MGFNDITSNFIVTEVGIMEGRGWDYFYKPDVNSQVEQLAITCIPKEPPPWDPNVYFPGKNFLEPLIGDGKIIRKISEVATIQCVNFNFNFCTTFDSTTVFP